MKRSRGVWCGGGLTEAYSYKRTSGLNGETEGDRCKGSEENANAMHQHQVKSEYRTGKSGARSQRDWSRGESSCFCVCWRE